MTMPDLVHSLDTVRRRWRTLLALRVSARALVAAAAIIGAAALAERWAQPADGGALALAVVARTCPRGIVALAWPCAAARTSPDRTVRRGALPGARGRAGHGRGIEQRGDGGQRSRRWSRSRRRHASASRSLKRSSGDIRTAAGGAARWWPCSRWCSPAAAGRASQVATGHPPSASRSVPATCGPPRRPDDRGGGGRRAALTRVAPSVIRAPRTADELPGARVGRLRAANRRVERSFLHGDGGAGDPRPTRSPPCIPRACSAGSITTILVQRRSRGRRPRRRCRGRRHASAARHHTDRPIATGISRSRKGSRAWRWRAWTIAPSSRRSR